MLYRSQPGFAGILLFIVARKTDHGTSVEQDAIPLAKRVAVFRVIRRITRPASPASCHSASGRDCLPYQNFPNPLFHRNYAGPPPQADMIPCPESIPVCPAPS